MGDVSDYDPLINALVDAEKIAVLTGAGISAESGIPTFRGEEGLWRQYRAEQLATPGAFASNPKLVWEWYNWRRGIIGSKKPNLGHSVLAKWGEIFSDFHIITQNIDGFHRKAESRDILELHGNIWKVRCTGEGTVSDNHDVPLKEIPPTCPSCGAMQRPHVVWFGESLDMGIINQAMRLSSDCDIMFIIGTSAVVQPAASLPLTAREAGAKLVEINPDPTPLSAVADFSYRGKAGKILPAIDRELDRILRHERN
ncbi:NAD-dependent deacetylase [Acidobacteriota bacterium]